MWLEKSENQHWQVTGNSTKVSNVWWPVCCVCGTIRASVTKRTWSCRGSGWCRPVHAACPCPWAVPQGRHSQSLRTASHSSTLCRQIARLRPSDEDRRPAAVPVQTVLQVALTHRDLRLRSTEIRCPTRNPPDHLRFNRKISFSHEKKTRKERR